MSMCCAYACHHYLFNYAYSILVHSKCSCWDSYGALPRDSYGVLPRDSYGALPRDSYGALPMDSYGALPRDSYGALPILKLFICTFVICIFSPDCDI